MKRQNINKFVATILGVILCFSIIGCDGDAHKTYTLTVDYVNETDQGVTALIIHGDIAKTLDIPAKSSRSYIKEYYVRGDHFFGDIRYVTLYFDDGKQVMYSRRYDGENVKTDLCNNQNYTKIVAYRYSASITADHYNEAK